MGGEERGEGGRVEGEGGRGGREEEKVGLNHNRFAVAGLLINPTSGPAPRGCIS